MTNPALLALAAALVTSGAVRADEEPSSNAVTVGGFLDTRFARTDDTVAFLDGGLGKTRYGALDGRDASLFRVSQASVFLKAKAGETLSAFVQANLDAEPDARQYRGRVDVIEAYARYRPEPTPHLRVGVKAGLFFPPVSMENDGPAWSVTRSITASAANSWIGEEVRVTGAELSLGYRGDRDEAQALGAAFGLNDPTGSLLAWRGWALQDRQTGAADWLPLAPIASLREGGVFEEQPPWVQPFVEVDGRLGWYAGGSWTRSGAFAINGLYFDNRGKETVSDGFQYAWRTSFADAGLRLQLPGRVEILGQHMRGRARMERTPSGQYAVDARFRTSYGLASVAFGRHRLTARYDSFRVADRDVFRVEDDNDEEGHAWTGAYVFRTGQSHTLVLEALRIESDRPMRASIGLPVHAEELLVQLAFRLGF